MTERRNTRGSLFKTGHWLGLFTALFFASVAIPVVAQENETVGRFSLSAEPAAEITYPELKPLEGNDDPVLAYNLSAVFDWSTQMPFIDVMKMGRAWIGARPDEWGGWEEADLRAGGYLDENGWVTSIPSDLELIRMIFAWEGNAYGEGDERAGTYELTYDGTGTLELMFIDPSAILSEEPGKIVFNIGTEQGNWGFVITETDPRETGDHIRNIHIVNRRHQELFEAGAVFNPDWIQHVKEARMVRFATWQNASNSEMKSWSEMPSVDQYIWTTVPLEIEIRLANEIGADPWFSLPFLSDDDFARQFATYVKDHLDPRLVAHVELSNEVWNTMFEDAHRAEAAATALWNLNAGDAWVGGMNYYGKRAAEIMDIWAEVYGDLAETRLVRVAGTQTVNPWLSEQILEAPIWKKRDRASYRPPHLSFDALSPTIYFGGDAIADEETRNALLSALKDPAVANFEFHYRLIKGDVPGLDGSMPYVFDMLREQDRVADTFGLRLVPYEGGQHVHHSAFVDIPESDLLALQEHMIGFVRSEQMAGLYRDLWEGWKDVGTGPFMQYTDVSSPSLYGSWGLRASNYDNPPRAALIDRLNAETTAWWEDRGGAWFQQGYVETGSAESDTVSGSNAEDFLIGLGGDDRFYPGGGNDRVNGGPGKDQVLFAGPRRDYEVSTAGDRLVVSGPDGRDELFDVEELVFSDAILAVSNSAPGEN